jgi:GTPase
MSQNFDAQIAILEHKSIICAGYSAVLHIHTVVEEVQITVSPQKYMHPCSTLG